MRSVTFNLLADGSMFINNLLFSEIISTLGEECDSYYTNPQKAYAKITELPFIDKEHGKYTKVFFSGEV